jgi:hypothetical protein
MLSRRADRDPPYVLVVFVPSHFNLPHNWNGFRVRAFRAPRNDGGESLRSLRGVLTAASVPHTPHAQIARRANVPHPDGIAQNPKSERSSALSRTRKRGGSRSSRTLGAGCGGRVSCEKTNASVTRTEKSCGSGAPMLALSSQRRNPSVLRMTVARKPGHREEHEGPR